MGARSISAKQLRADCTTLERAVLSARAATKESLAPHRPGGAENPARDASGWLRYFVVLHRTHAKASTAQGGAGISREAADAVVMDALRAQPVAVRLTGSGPDDPSIYVYPKSLHALLHIWSLDRQLAYMTTMYERLVAMQTAEAMNALDGVLKEISYTYHLLCWCVTYDQPGLPYSVDTPIPEPPAWILALQPWDVIKICEAHHKHLLRLHVVTWLIDSRAQTEEGGQRPSWSMFVAAAAEMFAESPETIMRDRSLVATLAAMRLATAAKAPPAKQEGA